MKNPKCRGVWVSFNSELGSRSSLHLAVLEVYGRSFPSSAPNMQISSHCLPGQGLAQHIFKLQMSRVQTGMEE